MSSESHPLTGASMGRGGQRRPRAGIGKGRKWRRAAGRARAGAARARSDHRRGTRERSEDEHERQERHVSPSRQPADARARRVVHEIAGGGAEQDADVVVRAGVDAVEAERAVGVPDLARQEQVELAATGLRVAADAILRPAVRARGGIPHAHLDPPRVATPRLDSATSSSGLVGALRPVDPDAHGHGAAAQPERRIRLPALRLRPAVRASPSASTVMNPVIRRIR